MDAKTKNFSRATQDFSFERQTIKIETIRRTHKNQKDSHVVKLDSFA
jgi:hypothetical protein